MHACMNVRQRFCRLECLNVHRNSNTFRCRSGHFFFWFGPIFFHEAIPWIKIGEKLFVSLIFFSSFCGDAKRAPDRIILFWISLFFICVCSRVGITLCRNPGHTQKTLCAWDNHTNSQRCDTFDKYQKFPSRIFTYLVPEQEHRQWPPEPNQLQ